MKKTILVVAFTLSASIASFAQISFGPKIGVGLSTFKDVKTSEIDPTGERSFKAQIIPEVGVVLNAQFGEHFAVRPELLFSQRAYSFEYDKVVSGTDYTLSGKQRISYLELPLNVVGAYHVGPGNIEVFAGASAAYVLGGKGETGVHAKNGGGFQYDNSYSVKGGKEDENFNLYNSPDNVYVNPWNFGINFGAGYKFDNGLFLQLGYKLGLSNMTAHSANSDVEDERSNRVTKASAFTLGVGYLFGGKK